MALRRLTFMVLFGAIFSILVLTQNQVKKPLVLKEIAPSIGTELSCVPCGSK